MPVRGAGAASWIEARLGRKAPLWCGDTGPEMFSGDTLVALPAAGKS